MSKDFTKQLGDLGQNIGEILLMVVDQSKIPTAAELIKKYGVEFHNKVKDAKTAEEMESAFKPFVNTVMSIVETLGVPEKQFKPTRKLILNEMYRFKETVLLASITEK
jgi:hypothetical protein